MLNRYSISINGVSLMAFGNVLWLVGVICAVWVIYDVAVNQKKMDSTRKLLWIIFAVILNIITAIVYYFVVKKKQK